MKVKTLTSTPLKDIIDCFLKAFENYFVPFPTDHGYYKNRWQASKVDFDLSFGMFDGDLLVGFILHAVDTRQGISMAYNAGTGVIPSYRGQGVVNTIYEYALPYLIKHGIQKTTLEVITENHKAIRAYEKAGFKKVKTYLCFKGDLVLDNADKVVVQEYPLTSIDWSTLPDQEHYSWDNQKETILCTEGYRYCEVLFQNKKESYFIINKNYVAQLGLFDRKEGSWKRVLTAIQSESPFIKINNVDAQLLEKCKALQNAQLQNTLNQYEMARDL